MSNVIAFTRREVVARSRNRKQALSVIIPRLMALRQSSESRTVFMERKPGLCDFDIVYTWDTHPSIPGGVYYRVEQTAACGGDLLMTGWINADHADDRVKIIPLAPGLTGKVLVSSWKRGGWEVLLFNSIRC